MGNLLLSVREHGQSLWYDNISRSLLRSGDMQRMIEEDGIVGVTSNPTIFEKAINREKTYDNQLHALVDDGADIQTIYEGLVIDDIRETADLLAPVYRETEGVDGYVSLEVSPDLANDTEGTIAEVKRLAALVDRDNLMVKVPATPAGIPAIERLIGEGHNINVTLIFSLDQYKDTAAAYIRGLEKWIKNGGDPMRPASVASFFVSRVDTMVDARLEELSDARARAAAQEVMSKAGIANAKLAYAEYKRIFHGEAFAFCREKGARPQRVLWASTSTKNPSLPDTYYVDALIGPETVNTLPPATLTAFRDHGRPAARLEEGPEEAHLVFEHLEKIAINIDGIMAQLLDDGVAAFAGSFNQLMEGIARKRDRLLRGWGHRSASLGDFQTKVDERLKSWDAEKAAEKLWSSDASLWTTDATEAQEIRQRLGWLRSVNVMRQEIPSIQDFADEVRADGYTHAVLLGMGGSSLASEVFRSCCGVADGYLDLKVLDTTIPKSVIEAEKELDLSKTLFIVSSKSGGTIEVMSLFKYFWSRVHETVGEEAGSRFIAITDPGSPLGKLASDKGFRKAFLNPADIGGRFSALSYFHLVPAALMGADVDRLLMRASQAVESSSPDVPALESPGFWMGAILGEAHNAGVDKLTLVMSEGVSSFGYWIEQLVAESTGKSGKGIVPIFGEPPGDIEHYGSDRIFVYLRLDEEGGPDAFVSSAEQAGRPVVTVRLHTAYDIGREMFRWQVATAMAGVVLGINPFDQPNVQESKDFTKDLLKKYTEDGTIPDSAKIDITDEGTAQAVKDLLSQARPGDYLAFNAFLHPTDEAWKVLSEAGARARDKYGIAPAVGFGPRYLHSTGQIHKGGADNGIFIELTCDDEQDVAIPGEDYSFSILRAAQAAGDYEALKKRGRRILRLHMKTDTEISRIAEIFSSL